ncbi:hypothetical protein [uncultured Maritalea sp.]|jgi:hypothetical protein|nr:hypothetical protein [uncultured Maritalea sp.]
MTKLKSFIHKLNAGEFTLLAFVVLVFIFATGILVGKGGFFLSQLVVS